MIYSPFSRKNHIHYTHGANSGQRCPDKVTSITTLSFILQRLPGISLADELQLYNYHITVKGKLFLNIFSVVDIGSWWKVQHKYVLVLHFPPDDSVVALEFMNLL